MGGTTLGKVVLKCTTAYRASHKEKSRKRHSSWILFQFLPQLPSMMEFDLRIVNPFLPKLLSVTESSHSKRSLTKALNKVSIKFCIFFNAGLSCILLGMFLKVEVSRILLNLAVGCFCLWNIMSSNISEQRSWFQLRGPSDSCQVPTKSAILSANEDFMSSFPT